MSYSYYNLFKFPFKGVIDRGAAERLLEEKPVGSFLVRLSKRIWGYTVSVRGTIKDFSYHTVLTS